MNDSVKELAVNSGGLRGRSDSNKQFGSSDFDAWVNGLIDGLEFSSVLDICCGTGNQLVLYAAREAVRRIVGVDLSTESLAVAQDRLAQKGRAEIVDLIHAKMDETFVHHSIKGARFDLISCFYGLYYSDDVISLLRQMTDHLSDVGKVVVVGPYGENNATFFEILSRYFELPELVYSSSCTFMEQEVVPLLRNGLNLSVHSFTNKIRYPDVGSLMKYWRATTFFSAKYEASVRRDLELHFARHGEFVMEKHVMAAIAQQSRKS
ncbi:class I SAM-dependent methyltransferase [Thermodesulfobacteriota bacterium]